MWTESEWDGRKKGDGGGDKQVCLSEGYTRVARFEEERPTCLQG